MGVQDGLVKKSKIAPFLNKTPEETTPTWVRIKKSTAFDLALNPETMTLDYIADEGPTEILKQYKPQLPQSVTMYKGEPDYDYIFDKFYNLETGTAAETDFLLVFFQEVTGSGASATYKAWKCKAMLSLTDLNSVDSTITFNIALNGTIERGSVVITDGAPVFTAAS